MQKKIIALAVAGLVSGAAFAQSNVIVYGVADANYTYATDSYNNGSKAMSAIQSGGQSGSRFGFKGTEDLGNGLSANFRMEGGINLDTGTSAQTGTFGRWSTVGLGSKTLGEIQLGRRDTFQDELLGGIDANGRTTVAQVSPVYVDQARIGNFVAWLSPNWNGLQLKAGFSSAGNDSAANDVEPSRITTAASNIATNTNLRVYTAAVQYTNGPIVVGAAYDYNKLQGRSNTLIAPALGSDSSYDAGNVWNIAGAYDFKVVRLHGAYGMINYAQNTYGVASGNETKDNRKQWALGLSAPVGANGTATVTYARARINYIAAGASDDKMSMWGVAYFHNLSKRTNLYAAYGDINQDSTFTVAANKVGITGAYEQAFQVGLRHKF